MMPLPLGVMFAILVGWPLLQITSVLIVSPRRSELRALAADLKADARYDGDDRALIDQVMRQAAGDLSMLLTPILTPLALLLVTLDKFRGRGLDRASQEREIDRARSRVRQLEVNLQRRTGREKVQNDPRFHKLYDLSLSVSMIRWPTTALLAILACLPVLPLYLLTFGLRSPTGVARRLFEIVSQITNVASLALRAGRA